MGSGSESMGGEEDELMDIVSMAMSAVDDALGEWVAITCESNLDCMDTNGGDLNRCASIVQDDLSDLNSSGYELFCVNEEMCGIAVDEDEASGSFSCLEMTVDEQAYVYGVDADGDGVMDGAKQVVATIAALG